jgi:type I restriction enzyme, S subunit
MIEARLLNLFDDLAGSSDQIPSLRRLLFACVLNTAVRAPDAKSRADILRNKHEKMRSEAKRKSSQLPCVSANELPPSLANFPTPLFERLENIASIEKGQSQIQSTKAGKYPLVVTAEARSTSDSWHFEGPSAIVPLVSSTGHGDASLKRIHYQEGKYAVGNILAVIQPLCPDEIQARFLFEYLSSFKDELLVSRMVGTANVSLTINKLKEVPIPLVSGNTLQRIDELMALCDRLEAQQKEREAKHTVLARAALARFAEAPTPSNLEYLFHKSYTIDPADLRKSILTMAVQGKLAEGEGLVNWSTVKLSNAAAEIVDCPHSTPKWASSGKICVRTNQLSPGRLDLSSSRYVSPETYVERVARLTPRQDDILYSREGGILGVACRVPPNVELCLGQRMMLIRPDSKTDAAYLELVLNSPLITEIARRQTTGAAAPRVNVATVKAYPIPRPPLDEQKRIVAKVDQLMSLVDELEKQLETSRTAAKNLLDAIVAELTGTSTDTKDSTASTSTANSRGRPRQS